MTLTMTWIDWAIVIGSMGFITIIAITTRKYTRSVADFLAANRLGGRYLLTIADGMAGFAAINTVAMFESHFASGFSTIWWNLSSQPLGLILAMTGYVVYRYRETRAMTMGQLFEIRYSKNFRIFMGMLGWLAGIINFGIFPAVGSRFFMYFCGLPHNFQIFGITLSTFAVIMFCLLAVSLLFTFLGGQIAVIVTDFLQGAFANIGVIIIVAFFLWKFDWSILVQALSKAPEGQSMVNPFHTTQIKGFNIWYFMTMYFVTIYGCQGMHWQGGQGYFCSAKSAHEFRMAKILALMRGSVQIVMVLALALGAYVVLNHESFADTAVSVNTAISQINTDNPLTTETLRTQMTVPIAASKILPVGILGLFCATMFAAFVSTHDTYLHSWGTMFIQDVIVPFRKKPFSPKQHLWLLRLSICFVAVFIFCFSLIFRQTQYILMFFLITGSIYSGGVGVVILGALYWRRGATAGAWAAMIWGATASVATIILQKTWPPMYDVNMAYMWVLIAVVAIILYVTASFLSKQDPFNIQRMLHRGKYALKDGTSEPIKAVRGLAVLGFSKDLPLKDKLTYLAIGGWIFAGFVVFVIVTICQLTIGLSDSWWAEFWQYYFWILYGMVVVVSIWFLIGGAKNFRELFTDLAAVKRNILDDGTVVDHRSLGEEFVEEADGNSQNQTNK